MRNTDEVQQAHDIFVAVILKEVDIGATEEFMTNLRIALDTLCWVLGHDHCKGFTENLTNIKDALKARGYAAKRIQ